MTVTLTRPNLFRTSLYFVVLYWLFRATGFAGPDASFAPDTLMPIEGWLMGLLGKYPVWGEILRFATVVLAAFGTARVIIRHSVYRERTYIPALIYLLVALGYYSSVRTPMLALEAFLLVFAVDNMLLSHKRTENFGYFLQAAVALGVMPLLYAPTLVFLPLLVVGFFLFRQNWRSVVTALIGYLFPVFLCCYAWWGMDGEFLEPVYRLWSILITPAATPIEFSAMGPWEYILTLLFFGLTIYSILLFAGRYKTTRSRAKRGFVIFIWAWVCTLGMIALPCRSLDMLPLIAVPMAALIPGGMIRKNGWLPNLLYVGMIAVVLLYQLSQLL